MNLGNKTLVALSLSTLLGASLLLASPAVADDLVFSAAWEGVWESSWATRDCDTGDIIMTHAEVDTICIGDLLELPEGEISSECTGEVTDTTVDFTCSVTSDVEPGCTVTVTFTFSGTRTGDTYSGERRMVWDFTGDCFLQDSCELETWEGTRTGEDPDCASTPTTPLSWGTLKDRYR